MNPDSLHETWKAQSSQSRLSIDADLLLQEVRRNQRHFAATIFWRDVREVGVACLMVPLWFFMGSKLAMPWTWYLMVPALVWIAGFMLVDRKRHRRELPEPGESLRQCVECSLREVDHQIWLIGNVFWWYILPPALCMLASFAQVTWNTRSEGWLTVLVMTFVVSAAAVNLVGIYLVNQNAIRTELVPRRQELETLLERLKDEPFDAGSIPGS